TRVRSRRPGVDEGRMDKRMVAPDVWIAVLRIIVGAWFFKAVWTKLAWAFAGGVVPYPVVSARFVGFHPKRVAEFANGNPIEWYKNFLETTVLPNAHLFATLQAYGEAAVGLGLLFAGALLVPVGARAEVRRVSVESRVDVLGGQPFGAAGPYEKLTGVIDFALDPRNPANARIVDLERAPRGADGLVEASATFMLLRPKDPSRGRGVVLVDVSNRGGQAALGLFNRGSFAADPTAPADFGDGLLLRQGLTLVWVGWEFDVPAAPGALRLRVPIATERGR